MTDNNIDFAALIAPVACQLWGEPTHRGEHELRWGKKGSKSVNLSKGSWYDHEAGQGGGVLELIMREAHCPSNKEAMVWLREHHLIAGSTARRRDDREARERAEEEKRQSWNTGYKLLLSAARDDAEPRAYLRHRGIERCPPNIYLVSAEESARLTKRHFPAMVVQILRLDEAGNVRQQGAQATWLTRDGREKLASVSPRKTYGEAKGGYNVFGELKHDRAALVAEGVETGLSARQLTGLPVIVTFGTSNMRTLPLAILECSEVIICADNDSRGGGLRAAEALAERLNNSGRRVRIALPPRDEDEDKRDWNNELIWAGRNSERVAELRDEIINAPRFTRSAASYALSMAEVLDLNVPEPQYLLKPWLETGNTAMIYARRGTFKTRLAMSVGYAIATGQELLGWEVMSPKRVLYVDGEMTTISIQRRLKLLGNATVNFRVVSSDIMLRSYQRTLPDLGTEDGRKFLDGIIDAEAADVVILDSLSTLISSGAENEAESWAPIATWMMMHRFRGRTVIIVHHEGKSGSQRGTSKREDLLDVVVRLKAVKDGDGDAADDHDKEEGTFELHFEKKREFMAAPMTVRLALKSGVAEWARMSMKDALKERVAELARQGLSQKDIAKELGKSPGRISQIASELGIKVDAKKADRKGADKKPRAEVGKESNETRNESDGERV
jgi:putative DNA primase/helicase